MSKIKLSAALIVSAFMLVGSSSVFAVSDDEASGAESDYPVLVHADTDTESESGYSTDPSESDGSGGESDYPVLVHADTDTESEPGYSTGHTSDSDNPISDNEDDQNAGAANQEAAADPGPVNNDQNGADDSLLPDSERPVANNVAQAANAQADAVGARAVNGQQPEEDTAGYEGGDEAEDAADDLR